MHVAVAIVGYRNAGDIVRCVAALSQCDYPDFEVIICENGGAAAYAALQAAVPSMLAKGQAVRLVQAAGNGGYASGVNICMAATPMADAWWILNPDTVPSVGAMGALVKCLEDGSDAAGGVLYLPNRKVQLYGGIWQSWLARSVAIGHGKSPDAIPHTKAVEEAQTFLTGASMMVGRRFLAASGPMREEYFLYCEEIDWCLRATSRGMRLGFAPTALVLHHQGTTTGGRSNLKLSSRLSVYLDERNKMLLTHDHFHARLPVAAISAFLLLALRYLARGAVKQFGYGVSGWLAGLRKQRGLPPWMREPAP